MSKVPVIGVLFLLGLLCLVEATTLSDTERARLISEIQQIKAKAAKDSITSISERANELMKKLGNPADLAETNKDGASTVGDVIFDAATEEAARDEVATALGESQTVAPSQQETQGSGSATILAAVSKINKVEAALEDEKKKLMAKITPGMAEIVPGSSPALSEASQQGGQVEKKLLSVLRGAGSHVDWGEVAGMEALLKAGSISNQAVQEALVSENPKTGVVDPARAAAMAKLGLMSTRQERLINDAAALDSMEGKQHGAVPLELEEKA